MNVKRGDVVLADLPYSDRTGTKKRPVLVVQCDRNNQRLDDVILALIMSITARVTSEPTQLLIQSRTRFRAGHQVCYSTRPSSVNISLLCIVGLLGGYLVTFLRKHRENQRLFEGIIGPSVTILRADLKSKPLPASALLSDALAIWHAGLAAVRSDRLVRDALHVEGPLLVIGDEEIPLRSLRRIVVVGAGKAGAGMAAAVEEVLGPRLAEEKQLAGWINVPADCVRPLKWIRLHAARPAGVNEPTAAGAAGATEILRLVESLTAGRLVPLPALRRRLGPAAGAGGSDLRWRTSSPSLGTSARPARTSSNSIRSASNSAGSKAEDSPGPAARDGWFRSSSPTCSAIRWT